MMRMTSRGIISDLIRIGGINYCWKPSSVQKNEYIRSSRMVKVDVKFLRSYAILERVKDAMLARTIVLLRLTVSSTITRC
jgi:hypothetical protein